MNYVSGLERALSYISVSEGVLSYASGSERAFSFDNRWARALIDVGKSEGPKTEGGRRAL